MLRLVSNLMLLAALVLPGLAAAQDSESAESRLILGPNASNLGFGPEAGVRLNDHFSLRVGSTEISIRDLVKLVEGSVIALDRDASEPMDVLVNGTLIAHGEIVVVDERFGVRLTDVVSPLERIEQLS